MKVYFDKFRDFLKVYFKKNVSLDEERTVKSTSGFDIEVVPVWKLVLSVG